MHYVLKPAARLTSNETNKVWKVSIQDSVSSFHTTLEDWCLLGNVVEKIQEKSHEYGINIQPMIFSCEKGEFTYAVKLDDIFYRSSSFIECLDACFKLFFVFDLDYPIQSKKFWEFIQLFFYEIGTTGEGDVINLIGDLNNL